MRVRKLACQHAAKNYFRCRSVNARNRALHMLAFSHTRRVLTCFFPVSGHVIFRRVSAHRKRELCRALMTSRFGISRRLIIRHLIHSFRISALMRSLTTMMRFKPGNPSATVTMTEPRICLQFRNSRPQNALRIIYRKFTRARRVDDSTPTARF